MQRLQRLGGLLASRQNQRAKKQFACPSSADSAASFSGANAKRDNKDGVDDDEASLHEEIPQKGVSLVRDLVGPAKRRHCAVYGAGLASSGALAIRSLIIRERAPEIIFKPKRITRLNVLGIKYVAAGCGFSLFASKNELYGSGLNNFYQLGGPRRDGWSANNPIMSSAPAGGKAEYWYIDAKRIGLPSECKRITWISAGRMHSIVLTKTSAEDAEEEGGVPPSKSRIFCWGSNTHGQCGFDPATDPFVTHDKRGQLRHVDMPTEAEIIKVHASLDTSFALTADGHLYAWGLGTDGQLGNGNAEVQWRPERVGGDAAGERILGIGGSTDTLLAVSDKGDVFIWGQNEYGQLGALSDEPQIFLPTRVPFNVGKAVEAQATGCSCIVRNSDGEVFTWGAQVLGFGPSVQQLERPMQLDPPLFASAARDDHRITKIFAGSCAMGALTEAGHMFSWGANRHGLLALSHRHHQYFPYQISFSESARHASFGPNHSLFVTNRY